MTKTLSERLAARAVKHKSNGRSHNLATVLALRGEIEQAIHDGWFVKDIWEALHEEGKVAITYQAFRVYVNRLLLVPEKADSPEKNKTSPLAAPPSELPGFQWNPVPKKEDLI